MGKVTLSINLNVFLLLLHPTGGGCHGIVPPHIRPYIGGHLAFLIQFEF